MDEQEQPKKPIDTITVADLVAVDETVDLGAAASEITLHRVLDIIGQSAFLAGTVVSSVRAAMEADQIDVGDDAKKQIILAEISLASTISLIAFLIDHKEAMIAWAATATELIRDHQFEDDRVLKTTTVH